MDGGLTAIAEERGDRKVLGNRWERPIDDTRVASVDLLIASYRAREGNDRHTSPR